MKTIQNIPEIDWCDLAKYSDTQTSIVLTTPNSQKVAGAFFKKINIKKIIYIQSSQKDDVDKIVKENVEDCVVYAVGGGRVMDIGRYIANCWGLKIICIPTILSSDAFLVDCTGIREDGCVKYVKSKKAEKILLDINLLSKAPLRYHLSGCGDVLSIYTGVYDWYLANKGRRARVDEKYSPAIAEMAESILESLIIEADEIKKGTVKGLEAILRALILEVTLCNTYGNSRPEEGGEHFFTYCIENKTKHFLHGEMVSLGILITAFLQNRDWQRIKKFMNEIGLNYKPEGINIKIVLSVLQEMKNYVKKYKLRYSVYNELDYPSKKDGLSRFLRLIGLNK